MGNVATDLPNLGGAGEFTVGQVASALGVSTHTLRWYEAQELLAPVTRDSAGRRRYRQTDVTWLRLLLRLRSTGMSIDDMRRYARLARQGKGTAGQRLRVLEEHRATVCDRIAGLQRDLEAINTKIEMYRRMELESCCGNDN